MKRLLKRPKERADHKSIKLDDVDEYIQTGFKVRYCYKYHGCDKMYTCYCNRPKDNHEDKESFEKTEWSYENNTKVVPCNTFGEIEFRSTDFTFSPSANFIRFDVVEDLDETIEGSYRLITTKWRKTRPSLIISVEGGHKKMNNLTFQLKKNFKQGLINVMTKEKTWLVAGGFNLGIHKLVSDAVKDFRCYHEDLEKEVQLIGISSWGCVKHNESLIRKQEPGDNQDTMNKKKRTFKYFSDPLEKTEKGKVLLDNFYDCFLFCDDGREKEYDVEVPFKMGFLKNIQKKQGAFLVEILFEGGRRSIKAVRNYLEKEIPVVIVKGSGRASNLISDALDIPVTMLRTELNLLVVNRAVELGIKEEDIKEHCNDLSLIVNEYRNLITVYDMYNPTKKLDNVILEAIITSKTEQPLEKVLQLCIKFECPDIAEAHVFSNQNYYKMNTELVKKMFLDVLIHNQPEFVKLFLENEVNIDDFLKTDDNIQKLYKKTFYETTLNFQVTEVLRDIIDKSTGCITGNPDDWDVLVNPGRVIQNLSGDILSNPYSRSRRKKYEATIANEDIASNRIGRGSFLQQAYDRYKIKDLYFWALLSGYTRIAEILWQSGTDHLISALIGATIFKNLAKYMYSRGYSDKFDEFQESACHFEDLALRILDEAYHNNKAKTYTLLIRTMDDWNKMTCLTVAVSSNMLEFLNHSACKSFITEVWMGEVMSPFTPNYKIFLKALFYPFMPSLVRSPTADKIYQLEQENVMRNDTIRTSTENVTSKKNCCGAFRSCKIFYKIPVVKFYLYLVSYIVFLACFSYVNLIELRPFSQVNSLYDILVETLVYLYVFGFLAEEIRQITDDSHQRFVNQLKAYFSGTWNAFDALIVLFFSVCTVCRFLIPDEKFVYVRCLWSISLASFYLRTMQFFFVSKNIGPKVIMIRNMLKDILFFLLLFGVFIMAYGTLARSIQSPNSDLSFSSILEIFFLPYFQTYGELMLDEFRDPSCNKTECTVARGTVYASFAVFMLFTNILLINLLIAMFGYTFNQIQESSEKYYSYIRIYLVQEFYHRPVLPPPFSLLYYPVHKFSCMCVRPDGQSNLLRKVLTRDEASYITGFEQMCADNVMSEDDIKSDSQKNQNAIESDCKSDDRHVEEILVKLLSKLSQSNPQKRNSWAKSKNADLSTRIDRLHSTRF